jgi:hypothetical protein
MRLLFNPQRRDNVLSISKTNETLTINGVPYDFSSLPNGATLPQSAINCEFICGDVERINGELVVPILLPIKRDASYEARFPQPMEISDGQVVLPR